MASRRKAMHAAAVGPMGTSASEGAWRRGGAVAWLTTSPSAGAPPALASEASAPRSNISSSALGVLRAGAVGGPPRSAPALAPRASADASMAIADGSAGEARLLWARAGRGDVTDAPRLAPCRTKRGTARAAACCARPRVLLTPARVLPRVPRSLVRAIERCASRDASGCGRVVEW